MRLFERLWRIIIESRRVRKSIEARRARRCRRSMRCRRKHEQDRAREARRKGSKPKRDRVDRYLAVSGSVHDEIMAMRREVAMRY